MAVLFSSVKSLLRHLIRLKILYNLAEYYVCSSPQIAVCFTSNLHSYVILPIEALIAGIHYKL